MDKIRRTCLGRNTRARKGGGGQVMKRVAIQEWKREEGTGDYRTKPAVRA